MRMVDEARMVDEVTLEDEVAYLPNSFHDRPSLSKYLVNEPLQIPEEILARLKQETSGFLVEDSVLMEIASALLTGHVVLQGPPGTGKTSLAAAVCRAFDVEQSTITGREDLSTYDLIGRQDLVFDEESKREIVVPTDGAFTTAVIECAGALSRHQDDPEENSSIGHWLVIDELNRANMDRAFGELFTVLGTDEVVGIPLNYRGSQKESLYIPGTFRLIGTINSIDKQFVNSMSLAIRRRFTFITLDIPAQKPASETWASGTSPAVREFGIVIDAACSRLTSKTGTQYDASSVTQDHSGRLGNLFSLLELVRYAQEGSDYPFLPIGTAPLIDTVELFLSRLALAPHTNPDEALDWAASAKLGSLFDVDHLDSDQVGAYAVKLTNLSSSSRFATELRRHAVAGQSYV